MTKLFQASHLLLALALAFGLSACNNPEKTEGGPGDNGGALPDQLTPTGIPQNERGPFNPETDINYQVLANDTVYFGFDNSTIPATERAKLEEVSEWMKANPGRSLFLAGHADKRGTPEYNRALGERRALAVREYLAGLGVPAASLYTNSYGSDRPAMDGDTEDAFAKNRRVEVGVVQRP